VVIAPPFGRERLTDYRVLRYLAVTLAQRGWVAVRFTWGGFGESAPLGGAAPGAAWREDLATAAAVAREASDHADVDAVGLRVGAALLAVSAAPFASRVLWEPTSGRAFLRQQAALRRIGAPDAPPVDGGIETPGEFFTSAEADALRELADPRKLAAPALTAGCTIVTEPNAADAIELSQTDHDAPVQPDAIDRLVAALPQDRPTRRLPEWVPTRSAVLRDPATGREVVETLVSFGPYELPASVTEPLGGAPATAAVLLEPASNEPKGVTTMWPALARRLAANGVTTLRADRRSSGDGEPAGTLADCLPTSDAAIADIVAAARWLRDRSGADVTGVGHCLGAWTLSRAARTGVFARLVGINQVLWTSNLGLVGRKVPQPGAPRPEAQLDPVPAKPSGAGGEAGPGSAATSGSGSGSASASAREAVGERLRIWRDRMRGREPFWLRDALAGLGFVESVSRVLAPASRVAAIEIFNSAEDGRRFENAYGRQAIDRLRRKGRSVAETVETALDHALLSEAGRRRCAELLAGPVGRPAAAPERGETPSQLGVLTGSARC